jgi:hypothetical protein
MDRDNLKLELGNVQSHAADTVADTKKGARHWRSPLIEKYEQLKI